MNLERPFVLSIAGFDPSGGAGITADLKTFEAHRVQGLGICSAITYQNDCEFDGLLWLSLSQMEAQLHSLHRRFTIAYAKIGLVQNLEVLNDLVDLLQQHFPAIQIVWDPILKASAGFTFHGQFDGRQLEELCQKIFMITPNLPEMEQLVPGLPATEGAAALSQFCHVLLKGGHHEQQKGLDYLNYRRKVKGFQPQQVALHEKHGSGCVLSAAITANLAKGHQLSEACTEAKHYVSQYLDSNPTRLGYHTF